MTEGKKAAEEPTARKQPRHEYVVFECSPETGPWALAARGRAGTEGARQWVKAEGTDGTLYQIACLIGEPVKVRVEQVEKRHIG